MGQDRKRDGAERKGTSKHKIAVLKKNGKK